MTINDYVGQLLVGLFLLVLGGALPPVLKKDWVAMNRPGPLTPQQKGELVKRIAEQEAVLENYRHYKNHPNDIILLMFQLVMAQIFAFAAAVCLPLYSPALKAASVLCFFLVFLIGLLGILYSNFASDKNIDKTMQRTQKTIDEAKTKLNTPSTVP